MFLPIIPCIPTQINSTCVCLHSERGGQHTDPHHCVRARRSHRSDRSHHGGESCSPRRSKQGPGEEVSQFYPEQKLYSNVTVEFKQMKKK